MEDGMEYGFAQKLVGLRIDCVGSLLLGLLPFFLNPFDTHDFTAVITIFSPQTSLPTSFWMEWNGDGGSRRIYGGRNCKL